MPGILRPSSGLRSISATLSEELNASYIIKNCYGLSSIGIHLTPPTGGTIHIEKSYDGENWEPLELRSKTYEFLRSVFDDEYDLSGPISCVQQVRFRTSVAGTAPGKVEGSLEEAVSAMENIEFGYPPHRIGFPVLHGDAAFDSAQTGTVLYQPTSGKTFHLVDLIIACEGKADAVISVFDETDVQGNRLYRSEMDSKYPFVIPIHFGLPYPSKAVNNALKLTTTDIFKINLSWHLYEV